MNMENSSNKKYLLIHGAYHGAWCWKVVKNELEKRGHEVYAIDLPGHGKDTTNRKTVTISSYVNSVQLFIEKEGLQDLNIVGHSFAGIVISKLVEKISNRIKAIIFVNGVVLDAGESFFDFFPRAVKEDYTQKALNSSDNSIVPNTTILKQRLFNDLTNEDVLNKIFSQLTPQPIAPYQEKVYLDNFSKITIPTYYIFCKNDISLPEELFEKILLKLPPGYIKIDVQSDHEIMFSHPNKLTEILNNIE